MLSLLLSPIVEIWLASSVLAIVYDWLCAPNDFLEAFRGKPRRPIISAMVIIFIGGPIALIATFVYHAWQDGDKR
jgi:hypothetical protein